MGAQAQAAPAEPSQSQAVEAQAWKAAPAQVAQGQPLAPPAAAVRTASREAGPSAADAAEAPRMKAEVAKAVSDLAGSGAGPKVDVQATSEGLLISLTDEASFAMFASGSAEPDAKVVRIMERVAGILKGQPGAIVVRGHTDSRPFRSATYDNWRLSSARAHMAQYMLVRGGLAEGRIERIEAFADRRPKLPGNPEAAENRRIEILLRKDKS
jgi:chemotaxis protein MotB